MRFAGYAAVFDRVDRGGDVVRAGAFAGAVERGAGAVPLLWQHEAGRPIGRLEYLKEDKRGLRVIARLSEGSAGREAAALLQEGAVRGLSFGYRVREAQGRSHGS
jgi:HK97 family phage prohead protease